MTSLMEAGDWSDLSVRPEITGGPDSLVSALTLFVLRVGADHHHPAMPANHPALVAHFLD